MSQIQPPSRRPPTSGWLWTTAPRPRREDAPAGHGRSPFSFGTLLVSLLMLGPLAGAGLAPALFSPAAPVPAAATSPVASGTIIAQDTFAGRTVSGSWGTASDGNTWALRSGAGAAFSVGASGGVLSGSASATANYLTLGSGTTADTEGVAQFSTADPNADDQAIILRFQDAGNFYAAGVASPNNSPELDIVRDGGGSLNSLASAPFPATAGAQYWVRAQVTTSGSAAVIALRAWPDGTAEPTTWQLTYTDASPLPAGGVGLDGYDAGGGWTVANFSAGDLSGSPTPPPPLPTPTPTTPAPPSPTSVNTTSTTISHFMIQASSADTHAGAQISTPGYATTGWYPAGARSTVYAALVADGVDPDPFLSTNMQHATGDFSSPWWYRADFTLPSPVAATTMVDFSGVISSADVWVNGTEVATNSQVAGAYTDHELDLTSAVHAGANTIALLVQPNNPMTDFTVGWIDWNPPPPDNNMGIFRDVVVRQSGGVDLRLPDISTAVSPSLTSAQLTVRVQARNDTGSPVNAAVAGTIGAISFSQDVALAAHSTQEVTFSPSAYPQLTIANPNLWWPAGMGGQPLYSLGMTAAVSSVVTDSLAQTFGIRDLQAPVGADGYRHFIVNGRPVLIRGAGWSPDLLLRSDEATLTAKMQYVVDMGLNAIRLEGHLDTDDFYNLADRLGILVLPGWECCDKWQESTTGAYSSADRAIAAASMTSEAQDLRNHPSVVAFLIGSDDAPTQATADAYVSALTGAGWPDPIISSVNDFSSTDGLGATGLKEPGPYDWVPPVYWYNKVTNSAHGETGGAFGFDTEMSGGADIPPMYTLNQMMTPAQQQTLLDPSATQYHAGAGGTDFDNLKNFDDALFARYGTPSTVAQYDAEAQLANYEATRAQYEAYDRNFTDATMPSTGLIYWQLTSAWTSLHWQLFDAYLDQGGAYYGVKKANEALHVQYSYDDRSVAVVNQGASAASGLTVHADVYNLDGSLMNSQTAANVSVPGGGGDARPLAIPASIPGLSTTYLVRLTLSTAGGTQVDRNVYWLSTSQDVLNYGGSTYAITPTTAFANLTGLASMAQTSVSASASTTAGADGASTTTVVVTNNSGQKVPAFFITLQMMAGGRPVLPEQWSDNELSLWPGESETVSATYQTSLLHGATPSVSVGGWNTGSQTIPANGGGPTGTTPAFTGDTPPATATVGVAYSYAFTASGSPAPTFSVASGALPQGLALSAGGVLSGTPTMTGTSTFTVAATNPAGSVNSPSLTITVGAPASGPTAPAFLADSPPTSTVAGAPYSYTFTASGTPAPTFSVASGSLPQGLALSAGGALSGTPTVTGTSTFTVAATNPAGSATTPLLSIAVTPAPQAPVFTAASPPPTATVGVAYSYAFSASGSPAPTFSVASGSLPAGLTLSPDGVLSGTPTGAGASTFAVAASSAGGTASAGPFTITVSAAPSAPVFTADTPPSSATVASAYSYTFAAQGSPAPAFAVASGSLPPGLGLSAAGVLSGSPTTAGTFGFAVSASNSAGSVTSPAVTITVAAAPSVPTAAGSVFASDSFTRAGVTGGWGTATDGHTWTVQSGATSVLSVAGNEGRVAGSATMATARVTLGTATSADTEVVDRYTSGDYAADAGHLLLRYSSPSSFYVAGLDSPVSGAEINVMRQSGTTESRVASVPFPAVNGTAYWQRARVTTSGSTASIQVRVWADGTPEPSTWNLTYTDAAPLTPGMAGIEAWDGGSGWAIDHFSAGNLSALPAAPVFIAATPPSTASVGVPYSYTFTAFGNPVPTFTVTGGTLPGGLSLSPAGVLSGTPAVTGTATFSVAASNSVGSTTAGPFTIAVSDNRTPPVFTADSPPAGAAVGAPYSYTFAATGTPAPAFALASGSLPDGLSLGAGGVLAGTPTTVGTSTFSVRASNAVGNATSPPLTITVAVAAVAPSFTAASPPGSALVDTPYSYTFAASGSPAPTFSVATGSLPGGLSLSAGGILSGAPSAAGTFAFRVQATNAVGQATTGSLSISVTSNRVPPAFTAASPPGSGTVGSPMSYSFAASGNPPPTFAIVAGGLPPGITLGPDGTLSGTPTATGSYSYRVGAANSAGSATSGVFSITVFPAPTIAMAGGNIFRAVG